MTGRLLTKWPKLTQDTGNDQAVVEETNDTQEVLDDILIRALTREYLDVFRVALIGGSLPLGTTMEIEEMSVDAPPSRQIMAEVISDLGILLLRNEKTCVHLFLTILG